MIYDMIMTATGTDVDADDWSVASLLVVNNQHIVRLVPEAVGRRSYELLSSYDRTMTSLAVLGVERTAFFAVGAAVSTEAFIARFSLFNPANL